MAIIKKMMDGPLGIPFVAEKSDRIVMDKDLDIVGIKIFHNIGSLGGGATGVYIPDTVLSWIRVYNKNLTHDYQGAITVDTIPWLIQILKEKTKFKQGVAATAEIYTLYFPTPQKLHSIALEFAFNSIANINDGDRTTYDGTLDIQLIVPKGRWVGRSKKVLEMGGTFVYGANAQYIDNWIRPTEPGYRARSLIGIVEDNGTVSATAITKIAIYQGDKKMFEGSIAKLSELALERFHIAPSTGVIYIPLGDIPIKESTLRLVAYIATAGTAVNMHYILTAVK